MSEKVFVQIENELVEANGETLDYLNNWIAEFSNGSAITDASIIAQNAARESALAKLAALGLTEEEIASL